ncbi:MAG: hypothetical protein CL878_15315 [Dehalococcoidia bacterium]|nr:hypothetical protein [Dehalococcoidia bacterium]
MGIYEDLGLHPVINGFAALTRLGGSLMPPPVVEAMVEASRQFVDLEDLQAAVGRRIAELTHNEAAYISSGAAAGLALATAACVAGTDPKLIAALPHPQKVPDARCQVIFQRCQRSGYDYAVRQVGVDMVEIGPEQSSPADSPSLRRELGQALSSRTAAVLYFVRGEHHNGGLPLAEVVEAAHACDVPVIVDAAAQLPPPENLWRFTQEGADLVIFSGGKGLCGPQATGLVLGRSDLIQACTAQGNPNQAIGQPMKVGKEELCGCLAAVEWFLGLDHPALMARYEARVDSIVARFEGRPGVSATSHPSGESGQSMPRALLRFDAAVLGQSRDHILNQLGHGKPAIEVQPEGADSLYINPHTLSKGQDQLIADRLDEILAS